MVLKKANSGSSKKDQKFLIVYKMIKTTLLEKTLSMPGKQYRNMSCSAVGLNLFFLYSICIFKFMIKF